MTTNEKSLSVIQSLSDEVASEKAIERLYLWCKRVVTAFPSLPRRADVGMILTLGSSPSAVSQAHEELCCLAGL
jgi:hypothetical protein